MKRLLLTLGTILLITGCSKEPTALEKCVTTNKPIIQQIIVDKWDEWKVTTMMPYGDEFGNRVESQLSLSKQALRQATDAGDSEAIATATEALSMATADKARHEQYVMQQKQYDAQEQAYIEQAQQQQIYQQSQPVQEEYNEPSDKARTWANKNTWFGKDQVATSVAFAVHKQLENEGFDTESDEYYTEIDKRVRQELPQRFNVEADKKPVQTVASATRNTSTGRKQNRIELTPSEQQLAKKLGVSFKDYAIQKARLQKS